MGTGLELFQQPSSGSFAIHRLSNLEPRVSQNPTAPNRHRKFNGRQLSLNLGGSDRPETRPRSYPDVAGIHFSGHILKWMFSHFDFEYDHLH
jgi:hypothetical protein